MSGSNNQTLAVQMEKVSKVLPDLFSLSTALTKVFKKTPVEKVSTWSAGGGAVLGYRIPVKQYMGGDLRVVSLDDGDLGDGSMATYQYMAVPYSPLSLSFKIPTLTAMATQDSSQAIVNVFKDTMDGALKSFAAYEDALAFGDGTGILATGIGSGSAPAGTNPVYSLEANFGPQRLELYQLVDVYNNAGTTLKGTALRVLAIDPVAKTATLSGTVASPANDDVIAVAGMSAPLAAGSTRYGLYSYNSSATSGSTNGLSRTTVPELVSANYTASAILSPVFANLINDYLIQRRDESYLKSMIGISHMAQRQAVYALGDNVAEWMITGPSIDKNLDRLPKNMKNEADKFQFGGISYTVCKRANRSRMDVINPDVWGRVELEKPDFYRTPDGKFQFTDRSASGSVKTATFFSMISTENTYSRDPGGAGVLSALTIPAGM